MLPFDWWMDSEGNCLLSRWETLRISSFGVITPNLDGSFVQVAHGLVPGGHQSAYVSSWVRLWRCAVLLGANGHASGTSGVHPCSHSLAVCHQARWLWSLQFFCRSCCSSRQLLALNFSGIFVLSTHLYPLVAIDDVWRFVDDEVFKTWKRHLDALVPGGMSGRSRRAVPFLCPSLVPPLLVLALLGLCLSLRPEIWPCSFLRRHAFAIFGFPSLICFFLGWPAETCLLDDRSHFDFRRMCVCGWMDCVFKCI